MIPEIKEELEKYRDELTLMKIAARPVENTVGFPGIKGIQDEALQLGHIQWMIYTLLEDHEKMGNDRVNRWFGFIQAVMWIFKMKDFSEMKVGSYNG